MYIFDQHAADLQGIVPQADGVRCSRRADSSPTRFTLTAPQFASTLFDAHELIDQAIGVVPGDYRRADAEDAFTELRAMSQAEHGSLAVAAQHVIDEAVRRSRTRHDPT